MRPTPAIVLTLLVAAANPGLAAAQVPGVSADTWEVHLRITDGRSQARVSLGMRPDASAGFDALHDVKLLQGSGVRAAFPHAGWPNGPYFMREIQGAGFPAAWTLEVDRVRPGSTVTVTWQLQYLPFGCERVDLVLVDEASGERIDLRRTDSYRYVADGSVRRFRVEASLTLGEAPGAPRLESARAPGRSGMALLRWQAPAGGSVSAAAYDVYRIVDGGTPEKLNDLPLYDLAFKDRRVPDAAGDVRYEVRALGHDLCAGEPSNAEPLVHTGNGLGHLQR